MRPQLSSSLFTSTTLAYRGKSLSASTLICSSNIISSPSLPPSSASLSLEIYTLVDLGFSSRELIGYRFRRPALKEACETESGLALIFSKYSGDSRARR